MTMSAAAADDDHEAEVLLQVPRADIDEIRRPEGAPPTVGERTTVVRGTELLVLSITFTEAQLAEAAEQLGVPLQSLSATPGEPVVIVVCGDYRVPLLASVAARRSTPYNYAFYLPTIAIGVNLDPSTGTEILEAFEFIVKNYGMLESGAIPPLAAGTMPAMGYTSAAPLPPGGASRDFNSNGNGGGAVPVPQPLGGGHSDYAAAAASAQAGGMYVRPTYHGGGGPVGPAPVPSHASLEEQQRAALEAARSGTMYAPPRQRPGSATMIMQMAPDLAPVRTSTRIAHGIGEFARKATEILTGGSDLAARGVRSGAQTVVDNTAACENPVHVPEAARGHVRRTRMISRGAVAVTGTFAATVVGVTSVISDQVSKRVRPVVPQQDPNAGRSGFDDVKEVGLATVGAAALIADAATDAARVLLKATCDGTTQVIRHKLGGEAGELAEDGLGLAQDAVASASNMKKAGLKSVAKATLKETAKKTVA